MAATNSNSQQKTQNESTNQQTGAGTGGAAIGAGSSGNVINVTNSDVQTVKNALDTVRDTVDMSSMAQLATSQSALDAVVKVSGQSASLLQSTFTQFTGALSDSNTAALKAQNNATIAGLEAITGQHITSAQPVEGNANDALSVKAVVIIGLGLLAIYFLSRNL
jgi:hypothetical protein